ncbi:hypothetical protein Tco_0324381 [Tanacetum coccineum]
MQADRQQRDPNKGIRRAANKYRFSSREVRTEVDEEQQINTDSAAERSEQRCSNAGVGVGRRCPALLHRRKALDSALPSKRALSVF